MLRADIAFVAALLVMIGANLYFGPGIGERVAMQWGLGGQPTWYAPRLAAMWGPVAFALCVRVLIWLAMTYTPDKVHGAEIGVILFSTIAAVVHVGILMAARKR
jgi:hypothetical protein